MRHLALALTPLIPVLAACARPERAGFWRPGASYQLVLVAVGPRRLGPAAWPPGVTPTDTAVLALRVDSVVNAVAYGHATGDTRNFGLPFHAVGGDRFVAARRDGQWRVSLNAHATDTGLDLVGQNAEGQLRGSWTPRFPSEDRGTFRIAPAI